MSRRVKRWSDPDNENEILVVHKDPVSVSRAVVALFLLLMAALSVGQQFYFSGERSADQEAQQARDAEQTEQFQRGIQKQIDAAEADRARIKALIVRLLSAHTPAEQRRILEEFVRSDKAATARATPSPARTSQRHSSQQPASKKPSAAKTSAPTQPTGHTPTQQPTGGPSSTLLPLPVHTCVRVDATMVCI
jgi:hypothetical protein